MAVTIRLTRTGMKKLPHYRVVVTDSRSPRDGKFLEIVGHFDPRNVDATATLKKDRIDYWISKGAKPSETVDRLIKRTCKTVS